MGTSTQVAGRCVNSPRRDRNPLEVPMSSDATCSIEGLTIDHVHANGCRNVDCVNPAHLEAVTQAENNRRAWEAGVR